MDQASARQGKIRPVTDFAKTIKIDGKNYGWGTFTFEHVATVLQNFRTLVFQIFPQDVLQNLKLQDVGDYNISFFNSDGEQKIHVIFKDELLKQSFAAIDGLKREEKVLKDLDATIKILQKHVTTQQDQVKKIDEELRNLKAVAIIALEEQNDVSAVNLNIRQNTAALAAAKAKFENSKRDLENILEHKRFAKEKFEHDKEHVSTVAYDCIQLDKENKAQYGHNKMSNIFANLAEVLADESGTFDGQDNDRVLKSKELRKRIFLTLIDLEKIAQELVAKKDNSQFFQAVGVAATISVAQRGLAIEKLEQISQMDEEVEFSIFSNPVEFEKAVRFIRVKPAQASSAGGGLAPIGPRPETARFNTNLALPPILPATFDTKPEPSQILPAKSKAKMAWEGDSSDGDETRFQSQEEVSDHDGAGSAHYSSDEFEKESLAEEGGSVKSGVEKELATQIEEAGSAHYSSDGSEEESLDEENELDRKRVEAQLVAPKEEINISEEEAKDLDQLLAGGEFKIYFEPTDNNTGTSKTKLPETKATASNAPSTLTEKQGEDIKKYLESLVEEAKNSRTKLTQKSQENEQNKLKPDNIWNFARYIYRAWINEGKKSINNKNGYYNIMNRGTAIANNDDDIVIILKTTSNPLIFHCRRPENFQILERDPKATEPKPIAGFDINEENKIFSDFIDRVAAIKGLSKEAEQDILQKGKVVEKKLQPKRPDTTKPTASQPGLQRRASMASDNTQGYGTNYKSPHTQSVAGAASTNPPTTPSSPKTQRPPTAGAGAGAGAGARPRTFAHRPAGKSSSDQNKKDGATPKT